MVDIDKNKYCELYLVRHGETHSNVADLVYGQSESELTEQGIEELLKVREKFKGINFEAIFSSDLVRAMDTAKIIKAERELEVQAKEILRERFFGEFEKKSRDEYIKAINELYPDISHLDYSKRWHLEVGRGVETIDAVAARYILALREISIGYIGKKVLVVGHGSAIKSFLYKTGSINLEDFPPGSFKNGGYVHLFCDGVDFFINEIHS